ncbi:MAG: GIY-YIG nuclease family protein [Anaerolineae bacterium]
MVRRRVLEIPDASLIAAPGTYAIGLHIPVATQCTIGALGEWTLPAGLYFYVGSAWGPGGLAARVRRHLRGGTVRRWHIDYVRAWAKPVVVWLAPYDHDECAWAAYLLESKQARVIVPRCGASDCRCAAHLLYCGDRFPEMIVLPDVESRIVVCVH